MSSETLKAKPEHLCQPGSEHRATYSFLEDKDQGGLLMAINLPYDLEGTRDRDVSTSEYHLIRRMLAASVTGIGQASTYKAFTVGEELLVRVNPVFDFKQLIPRLEFFLRGFAACDQLSLVDVDMARRKGAAFGFGKPQAPETNGLTLPDSPAGRLFADVASHYGRAPTIVMSGAKTINEFERWCATDFPQSSIERLQFASLFREVIADPEMPWVQGRPGASSDGTYVPLSAFWSAPKTKRNVRGVQADCFNDPAALLELVESQASPYAGLKGQAKALREAVVCIYPEARELLPVENAPSRFGGVRL